MSGDPGREEGLAFQPKFGGDGLATCVTVDARRGDVLMVAHMNAEALEATLRTGVVHYWSRSRETLWRKGDTSGQIQRLVEMRVDCDQDAFVAFVRRRLPYGPSLLFLSSHRDRRSRAAPRIRRGREGRRLTPEPLLGNAARFVTFNCLARRSGRD
jgi:phosphoribosyl-AMP cyclohydrolase